MVASGVVWISVGLRPRGAAEGAEAEEREAHLCGSKVGREWRMVSTTYVVSR